MKFNSTYFIYPGGMIMPGRFSTSGDYRYGYNGMEMDNETSGNGNSYTTEFRQYDPRLMRWKSLDPLMMMFPWMSPYVAFDNNPIYYIDPYGLCSDGLGDEGGDGDPPSGNAPERNQGNIYSNYDFKASGKALSASQVAANQVKAIRNQDDKYRSFLGTQQAYNLSRSMINNSFGSSYTSTQHYNNYVRYGWGQWDSRASNNYDQTQLEKDWGDPIGYIKTVLPATLVLGLTGGLGAAYVTTGGLSATATYVSEATLFNYLTAEAYVTTTVNTLVKFTAGRVLIWTTSITLGTTLPGGTSKVNGGFSYRPVFRAPPGGTFSNGKFFKGGQFYPGNLTFSKSTINVPNPFVSDSPMGFEPWPANSLPQLGLSNPWLRGGIVVGGTYLIYNQLTIDLKNK